MLSESQRHHSGCRMSCKECSTRSGNGIEEEQEQYKDASEEFVPTDWARGTVGFTGKGRKWTDSRLTEEVESKGLGDWILGWREGKC